MLSALMGLGTSVLNNVFAGWREDNARQKNFHYNEMAAENADKRTRALYNDLYSANAQLNQLRQAGLSPSVFFGGQGASGMSVSPNGAEGSGVNGIAPNMHFIDPLTAAQIDNIKADTANKKENTESKSIENEIKLLESNLFKDEYDILKNTYFTLDDGSEYSLYEDAQRFDNFEDFLKNVREMHRNAGADTNFNGKQIQVLQNYYNTAKRLDTEITSLQLTETDNDFNKAIIKALKNENYPNLNAESIAGNLRAAIAQAELDEEQRNAWNRVINSIENENTKSALIMLSIILDRALSSYRITPNITRNKNRQIRSNE